MPVNQRGAILAIAILGFSSIGAGRAIAEENLDSLAIYHCEYRIDQGNKSFVMSGNLVPSDASSSVNHETYLSLEPPKVSGINITARVLIGADNYNPMTLHPRGDTVKVLASAILSGGRQQLKYVDPATKASYALDCQLR